MTDITIACAFSTKYRASHIYAKEREIDLYHECMRILNQMQWNVKLNGSTACELMHCRTVEALQAFALGQKLSVKLNVHRFAG